MNESKMAQDNIEHLKNVHTHVVHCICELLEYGDIQISEYKELLKEIMIKIENKVVDLSNNPEANSLWELRIPEEKINRSHAKLLQWVDDFDGHVVRIQGTDFRHFKEGLVSVTRGYGYGYATVPVEWLFETDRSLDERPLPEI